MEMREGDAVQLALKRLVEDNCGWFGTRKWSTAGEIMIAVQDLRKENAKLREAIESWKQEELLWKELEASYIAERDKYKAALEEITEIDDCNRYLHAFEGETGCDECLPKLNRIDEIVEAAD